MVAIAPSILSADFSRLGEQVREVEDAGAEFLHLDIMDGHFVPNITMGPQVVKDLRSKSRMVFDAHLMVNEPGDFLKAFAEAGADYITVHVETTPHLHGVLHNIKQLGCRCGVALNPGTSVTALDSILGDIDMVLVMSVNPGFGGQVFIESSLAKIRSIRRMLDTAGRSSVLIQVDGGVNTETAPRIVQAGAGVLVAGAAVFNAQYSPGSMVRMLKECAVES